jgi:hypothetical protein
VAMPILPTRTWACISFDTQVTSLLLVGLPELARNSEYAILRDIFAEVIICPKGTHEKVPANQFLLGPRPPTNPDTNYLVRLPFILGGAADMGA